MVLKDQTYTWCSIYISQISVNRINHYFINTLYQATNCLQCTSCFVWLKCFNNRSGLYFLYGYRTECREHVFFLRTPHIRCIILFDTSAFYLEPISSYCRKMLSNSIWRCFDACSYCCCESISFACMINCWSCILRAASSVRVGYDPRLRLVRLLLAGRWYWKRQSFFTRCFNE